MANVYYVIVQAQFQLPTGQDELGTVPKFTILPRARTKRMKPDEIQAQLTVQIPL
jgi:hypothetical protein